MSRKKKLNTYGICEAIAKRSGQPIGLVNKAIVAAGLVQLLEKSRLDPKVFTKQNVEHLQQEALGLAHLYGLLERDYTVGAVRPVWETDGIVKTGQKQETPPTAMAGFLEAYGALNSKVESNGNRTAECKENLLDHPDVSQP